MGRTYRHVSMWVLLLAAGVLVAMTPTVARAATQVDGYTIECSAGADGAVELLVATVTPGETTTAWSRSDPAFNGPDGCTWTGGTRWVSTGFLSGYMEYEYTCTEDALVEPESCVLVAAELPFRLELRQDILGQEVWVPLYEYSLPLHFPLTDADGMTSLRIPVDAVALGTDLRLVCDLACPSTIPVLNIDSGLLFTAATQYDVCDCTQCPCPDITQTSGCMTVVLDWDLSLPVQDLMPEIVPASVVALLPEAIVESGSLATCVRIDPALVMAAYTCNGVTIPAIDTGALLVAALNGLVAHVQQQLGPDALSGDFGWYPGNSCDDTICPPTLVELQSFRALGFGPVVLVYWQTALEQDNAGFNLYCSDAVDEPYCLLNEQLIAGQGSEAAGASYLYLDVLQQLRGQARYRLDDVENGTGPVTSHGPIQVERLLR